MPGPQVALARVSGHHGTLRGCRACDGSQALLGSGGPTIRIGGPFGSGRYCSSPGRGRRPVRLRTGSFPPSQWWSMKDRIAWVFAETSLTSNARSCFPMPRNLRVPAVATSESKGFLTYRLLPSERLRGLE